MDKLQTFSWAECFANGGETSPVDPNFQIVENPYIKNNDGSSTLLLKGMVAKVYDDFYFFPTNSVKSALVTLNFCIGFLEYSKSDFYMSIQVNPESDSQVQFFEGGLTGNVTIAQSEAGLCFVQTKIDNKTRSFRTKHKRDPEQPLHIP